MLQNIHFMRDENEVYICMLMEDFFDFIQTAFLEEFVERCQIF
jgi:hypothetical protein